MTLTDDPGLVEEFALSDRYEKQQGRVYLTGIQALARLPIDQARRDRAAGRRVGVYVSGYEGSPLAGYDLELARQSALLDEHDITFEPGLNEELAATAVQGTQLIGDLPARVDGVVGFWYGKSPGLDRAGDALRHANLMGTDPRGGAVALVGDDPAAKSSTVPSASERSLADLGIPTFYPADAGEVLEHGRHAVALSRASGLWTALKIVTAVADGSTSVDLLGAGNEPIVPRGAGKHVPTAKLVPPELTRVERDFMTVRMRLVRDYLRLNRINHVVEPAPTATVGIIASGKTFLDVQEAVARLGLRDVDARASSVRLLKLGAVWPLDPDEIRAFAEGLDEIVVVEEKRAFVETHVREALYDAPIHPRVVGKRAADGTDLFAPFGELDSDAVTLGLATVLRGRPGMSSVDAWLDERDAALAAERRQLPLLTRTPYYCSGCPHNTSTRPRTDSLLGAGIGCHGMVLLMDDKQVGNAIGLAQMGGEGSLWIGMAPFVEAPHFVQNLGDGTFHHSGSLAIRAAVASQRNITFRLLYNSAVAMTGGQTAVGQMSVSDVVRSLRAEGVARVIVTTHDVRALRRAGVPTGVSVWHRSRIADAEKALAATPGTTVLVHEQECATELRRKRKRGLAPRPERAVMINERLCEGCGDCGQKSNCLSVHPVETEFGRKTAIHQSSCNVDLTCLSGDCPAFMTVKPGSRRTSGGSSAPLEVGDLPVPVRPAGRDQDVRLLGVGGTGVVTTSQVLATAAVLSGRHVRALDQTGLAQKGGAVVSDVRISAMPVEAGGKIGQGGCDLYLGYDVLVAADVRNMAVLSKASNAIVSTSVVPTGAMVTDPTVRFPAPDDAVAPIADRVGPDSLVAVDARHYVEKLFGAEQFANMFLVGIAVQCGALALSSESVEQAISLNGVAVEKNVQAFRRGRQLVADRPALDAAVASLAPEADGDDHEPSRVVAALPGSVLEALVARRRADLVAYQDVAYARRYEEVVEEARAAEVAAATGATHLSEAVATYLHKLMAYKDEYEVARLALDPRVAAEVSHQFGEGARASWRLHPPTLRAMGMRDKLTLGRWFAPVLGVLYRARSLRGTRLDVFGYAHVRRVERRLVEEYIDTVRAALAVLDATTYDTAVRLASLPDGVRGYEDVKLRSVAAYSTARAALLTELGLTADPAVRRQSNHRPRHADNRSR